MNEDNILETEILNIFFPAFKKALQDCRKENRQMKIVEKKKGKYNSTFVKIQAEKTIDLYYLGMKFGNRRSAI